MTEVHTIPDEAIADDRFMRLARIARGAAWYSFNPRADDPVRHDEQTSFVENQDPGVAFLIGGNGSGTTECAMHKLARFVQGTPAPRPDTPFWVIANTYEMSCKACWVEKLHGHGHIPDWAIDWPRVRWYSSPAGWPYAVPLKKDEHGNNWTLEFKSYEQGRAKFQAEAIGGFCFVEQFPWGLLEEVLRGCREYNIPGSKFCEFTPVDPNLSVELEEMIENEALPAGWRIYRANTLCAKEQGHVDAEWFDEFFGMIPEEMLETRMTGEFAIYEGAVYKSFNPYLHLVGDAVVDFPANIHHRRAIDWGAGPDNAFVCLWAYRNGLGQWFVYDEYYSTDQEATTVDHLCRVQDRHPWPGSNPHYGTTYADPSSPDNIRIAQKLSQYAPDRESVGITRGANAVLEGIEHVQFMLKATDGLANPELGRTNGKPGPYADAAPRLFIHKERCPNLARQMRTYRWKRSSDMGLNPQDAKREPLKKNDHAVDALRYLLFTEARMEGGFTPASGKRSYKRSRGIQLHGSERGLAMTGGRG